MPPKSRTTLVRKRVWNLGRLLVLMAALVAAYAVFFLTASRVTSRARDVEVPNLQGKSIDEARTMLAQRGLTVRVEDARRPDKTVPADHVLTQEPAAGQIVRRQRAIRVRLSDGLRAALLPALAEYPERTAEVTLEGDRIAVGYKAEIRSMNYKPGVVVSQDPPARQRSESVNLLINRSDGSQSYVVPDVIGTLGIRSADVLRSLGFRVAVTSEVAYPGLPPGIVVRQAPQSGFQIAANETITLEVSK
jgi:eukaryotic-like serine/threonine-protein kinase